MLQESNVRVTIHNKLKFKKAIFRERIFFSLNYLLGKNVLCDTSCLALPASVPL